MFCRMEGVALLIVGVADVLSMRRLAGPPITNNTAAEVLLKAGVTVALGVQEAWEAANIRWEAGWVRKAICLRFFL